MAKGRKDGSWDPTAYGDWWDNLGVAPKWSKNDAAIEARAAMSSWGDSYLRDESGAAIPEPEREAYYEIYFPQMGDSMETIRNKEKLRWDKMNNARIAAGEEESPYKQSRYSEHFDKSDWSKVAFAEEKKRRPVNIEYSKSRNMTRVTYSDNSVETHEGKKTLKDLQK